MKISYRTHPILEKLHSGKLGVIPIYEDDKMYFDFLHKEFKDTWEKNINFFRNEIINVSEQFIASMIMASEKLKNLYVDICQNNLSDFEVNGTYIIKNKIYMIHHYFKKDSEDIYNTIYCFSKDGMPLFYYSYTFCSVDDPNNIYHGWLSNNIIEPNNLKPNSLNSYVNQEFINNLTMMIILIYMFKNYAQVETKYLLPSHRIKEVDCKYINETKLPITYLDSKWFTTLVKSDAFKVRGHFRLQPKKKESKWTHELIWINDFMKTGYTAPARKLSQTTEAL